MAFTLPRRAKAVALVISACLVTACSALVDLSGLAGGAGGGGRPDASPDAPSVADGGVSDTGASVETDAGAADTSMTDASGPRFCATQDAYFCDDFDNGALAATWDGITLDKQTPLKLDTAAATSAPNSLLMSIPNLDAVTSSFLTKNTLAASRISVAFDWRMDASHPNGETDVLHIGVLSLPAGFSSLDIYFGCQSHTTQLEIDWTDTVSDGGNYQELYATALGSITTGTFLHFVVTVDVGAHLVSVTNGVSTLTTLPLPSVPALPATLAWSVDMGGEYVGHADEPEASRLDNIVIRTQ